MSSAAVQGQDGASAGSFADIVALARQMLEAARAGEWETVTAREAERRARIAAFFDAPAPRGDAQEIAEGIESLLVIDRQIMQLARARMGDLGTELNGLQTGRRAQRAYAAAGEGVS